MIRSRALIQVSRLARLVGPNRAAVAAMAAGFGLLGAVLLPAEPARGQASVDVEAAVAQAAAQRGISPATALCIVRRESTSDPSAVSPQGHLGLWQFERRTWAEQAPRFGLPADPAWAFDAAASTDLALALIADGQGWRWGTWWRCVGA